MISSRKATAWMRGCTLLAPLFSTCAKRQYFAVVLADNGRVAGVGYNGAPSGMTHCVDGGCPRLAANSPNGSSYDNCVATHAEANALLWSDQSLRQGGALIVNGPPCMGCAQLIASSGIVQVFYLSDPAYLDWGNVETFLRSANVATTALAPSEP